MYVLKMGEERYGGMGWGEQYQGGSSRMLHNPTNQVSELGLSFPFINLGRTGVGRKRRNLALLVPAGPF